MLKKLQGVIHFSIVLQLCDRVYVHLIICLTFHNTNICTNSLLLHRDIGAKWN